MGYFLLLCVCSNFFSYWVVSLHQLGSPDFSVSLSRRIFQCLVWGLGAGLFSVFLGTAAFLYLSFFDPTFGALSTNLWDLLLFVGFGTTFGILIDREKKLRREVQKHLKILK